MKRRILAVSMASIIAVLTVACASNDNNQAEHTDLQTTGANEEASEDNAATDNESSGIATVWTKDGNYIDDQSNHLVMYKTSVELVHQIINNCIKSAENFFRCKAEEGVDAGIDD